MCVHDVTTEVSMFTSLCLEVVTLRTQVVKSSTWELGLQLFSSLPDIFFFDLFDEW